MFRGIDHIALAASDPGALIDWYCHVLGFQVIWRKEGERPAALLRGPEGGMIEVMPDNGRARVEHDAFDPGFRHLAIGVEDFEAACRFLESRGVRFEGEPGTAAGGGTVVSFSDPEGNMVQIVARPSV